MGPVVPVHRRLLLLRLAGPDYRCRRLLVLHRIQSKSALDCRLPLLPLASCGGCCTFISVGGSVLVWNSGRGGGKVENIECVDC